VSESVCLSVCERECFFKLFFIERFLIIINNKEIQQRKNVWQSQNVQYKYYCITNQDSHIRTSSKKTWSVFNCECVYYL